MRASSSVRFMIGKASGSRRTFRRVHIWVLLGVGDRQRFGLPPGVLKRALLWIYYRVELEHVVCPARLQEQLTKELVELSRSSHKGAR